MNTTAYAQPDAFDTRCVNCWNNGRYPRARYNRGDMPHSHDQEHASSHELQRVNRLAFGANAKSSKDVHHPVLAAEGKTPCIRATAAS
jgi:hypothetical protein